MNWNSPIIKKPRKKWTKTHNIVLLDTRTKTFTSMNPKPEKKQILSLTPEDEERLLKEFQDIFKRPPDKAEMKELYVEEFFVKFSRQPSKDEVERLNKDGIN